MSSFHLRLGLPSDLFHLGFLNKILYASLLSLMRSTRSAHLMCRLANITREISLSVKYRNVITVQTVAQWYSAGLRAR
jgi:hypothetical protein